MSAEQADLKQMPLPRPPRPWLAGLLSLIVPGLGQAYLNRWRAAVPFVAVAHLLMPLVAVAVALDQFSFAVFLTAMAASVGIPLVAATSAFVMARHTAPFARRFWTRWYGLILVAIAFVGVGIGTSQLYDEPIESFSVPSASMRPGLETGDVFIASRIGAQPIERGEIVVFHWSSDGEAYVKRVVALAGDTVELRDNQLFVNDGPAGLNDAGEIIVDGMSLRRFREVIGARSHDVYILRRSSSLGNRARQVVPLGHVFVLGDNRDNSEDSRMRGAVKIENVRWRAAHIFWSRDLNRIGIDLRQ